MAGQGGAQTRDAARLALPLRIPFQPFRQKFYLGIPQGDPHMLPVLIHRGSTYKNANNQRVRVVTPSGKHINRRIPKKGKRHRCHGCNRLLPSIAALRPAAFARLPASQRRVSRPYGATHCGKCVSKKVVEAFLSEEVRRLKESQ